MKILIQNLDTQKGSNNVKVLDIISTDLETSNKIYFINNNEIPLIKFTDTEELFLIKELNFKLLQNNSETMLDIVASDLVSLNSSVEPLYKTYTALLTQTGTDAPVATVLENTLGTITFDRSSVGNFEILSDELFTENKTYFVVHFNSDGSGGNVFGINNNSSLYIEGYTTLDNTIIGSDNLFNTPIEIRVYN